MSHFDRIALLVSLLACAAAFYVASRVYERVPHIEDEMAFVWQARAIAGGSLWVRSPQPNPDSFKVPFVIDYQSRRFGKYPIGWPVVLAFGELAQARHLVNPLLTGAAVWLLYCLSKKLLDQRASLLAAFLTAVSPFVLLNAGSLNSHPLTLLLSLAFCIAWLDAFTTPNPLLPARANRLVPEITAALALGLLALTRPWTALAVAAPFALHGIILFTRGNRPQRLRLLRTGAVAGLISSLYFLWQYAVTGDPFLNPYTLWWPYDTVGFGPGIGLAGDGHTLAQGWTHTLYSLWAGNNDLLGWPYLSWLFLPFGLWAIRPDRRAWLMSAVLPALVAAYMAYWTPAGVYGPRYYYEALFVPIILTAAGICWLAGRPDAVRRPFSWKQPARLKLAFALLAAAILIAVNLLHYLPTRMKAMTNLYGVSSACTQPLLASLDRAPDPTLVFVHARRYFEYACLADLNSPFLDSHIVIAISRSPEIDEAVARSFPGRLVRHYYPDTRRLHDRPRDIPPTS